MTLHPTGNYILQSRHTTYLKVHNKVNKGFLGMFLFASIIKSFTMLRGHKEKNTMIISNWINMCGNLLGKLKD